MSFKKETSVLLYSDLRSSTHWSKRQYLLFPAWCYRVVAPRIHARKVNILEKAVLGMCQVGAFSAKEIGEKLEIGTDLAALIIQQLSEQNLINNKGFLTEQGLGILEHETLASQDMVAGFIFQDPWTRELFPRFVERQEYAEVNFNQGGYPDLLFGTTGKPDYRRAYMPLPIEDVVKTQPSPQDILQAVRKHEKALRYRTFSEELDGDDDVWTFNQVPNIQRISFVEEEPVPVWLTTFLYLPKNSSSTTSWYICDPFGLGDSPWLRRKLEIQIKKNPSFRGLQKLILEIIDEYKDEEEIDRKFTNLIQQANEEAEMRVEHKLTIEIRRWDRVFNNLVGMERTYIEAQALVDLKNIPDKLDDILVKAQKVVESLFLTIREIYPTAKAWQLLSPQDREHNRNLLNGLANKLGFITPLPSSLVDVKQGKVRFAADSGRGSLRSYILAGLLTARHGSHHPLQLVAQKAPDMLIRLDKLAGMRDRSSHSSNQQLEIPEVLQQISTVYEVVASTLELNYQP
ncbi:hypothetical protein F7734_30000 [Scytonema sp. UIC 10036]|uniref:hypothetical protein n=1 Tax=Scytonema sp. UIC 10036 TaxID=2304196 RepID=UPI0012DABB58|nr:hypothetical protein [Scytonema sp. UIC 10036]MUG96347.1 hypothetical protein [Scytonema sp. UIC 10036]